MAKTAMQDMVEYLIKLGEFELATVANSLLMKEKLQITDAYYDGGDDSCPNGKAGDVMADKYFENKYTN